MAWGLVGQMAAKVICIDVGRNMSVVPLHLQR